MGETAKHTLDEKCAFVIAGMLALGIEPTCENVDLMNKCGFVPDDIYKEVAGVCRNDPVRWGQIIYKARYWVCVGSCK